MRSATRVHHFTLGFLLAGVMLLAIPSPIEAADGRYRLLELDGYKVKWGDQKLGVGASISYAFASENLRFDDARNCRELAPIEDLAGGGLSLETLQLEAAAAFHVWERAANLSFFQVSDTRDADIILGAQRRPRAHAFADVSYAPGADDEVRTIDQALVCLNPAREWKVGFNGDEDIYDIRYTLVHEIGHAIGLDHPGASGEVMAFRYSEDFNGLQPGDLRGVRELYGHPSNNAGPTIGFHFDPSEQLTAVDHDNALIHRSVFSTNASEDLASISDVVFPQYRPLLAMMISVGDFLGIGGE